MKRKIIYLAVIGCVLSAILFFCGCMKWEEPTMLDKNYKDTPFRAANREKNRAKDIISSQQCAQSGWYYLHEYKRHKWTSSLKNAGRLFNYCWFFDPENYNSYWGWGIVMGERASLVNEKEAEKFLISSLDLFQLASQKEIPPAEKNNFYMDWANVYNGVGAFFAQNDDTAKSLSALNKGKILLLDVLKKEPTNGRAYFLLSVNYFYHNDITNAKQYADKALEYKFALPPEYVEALESNRPASR